MIWNQWKRGVATADEILDAARAVMGPLGDRAEIEIEIEVERDCVLWVVRQQDLRQVAELLDSDGDDLAEDWEVQVDEAPNGESYTMVVDVETDENETVFTWNPKRGDNNAAWPIAWLVATRLVAALDAMQVTTSAAALLAPCARIGAATVALPLMPIREQCVLPTGIAKPLSVGRPASIAALRAAIASHSAWCILAVQIEPSVEAPSAEDLHPVGCVAKVLELVELSPGNFVASFCGADRVEIASVGAAGAGLLEARGVVLESARPDERTRALLLQTAELLGGFALSLDNLPDDAQDVLERLPPDRLADGAAEIFAEMLDAGARIGVLQARDASERLMIVVEALGALVTRITNALDKHHGNLAAARIAITEEDAEALRRAIAAQ